MRIAMISEPVGPLDMANWRTSAHELAAALTRLGHDVRIYVRRTDSQAPSRTYSLNGVPTIRVAAGPSHTISGEQLLPHMREFAQGLCSAWRAENWIPAVVHSHHWAGGLAAVTAARRSGVPVAHSFHQVAARMHGEESMSRSRSAFERALSGSVDRIIAFSRHEQSEIVGLGLPRSQVDVVAPGVDTRTFTPHGPVMPLGNPQPRVLAAGNLLNRNGFSDLVTAMRYVTEAELVIVGSSPNVRFERDPGLVALRDIAERFGLSDRLQLFGAVPHHMMPRWYRSADVVVSVPWYGRCDRSVLEAMACGVPVIGTAVTGINEAVISGLTGDLVLPRSPRSPAAAIRGLLGDTARRAAYAAAATDRAQQAFSWDRSADQVSAVYESIVSGKYVDSFAEIEA